MSLAQGVPRHAARPARRYAHSRTRTCPSRPYSILTIVAARAAAGQHGSFGDASWMASDLDAYQSIVEHAAALDAVQRLVHERLGAACPLLSAGPPTSPRTAQFRSRFAVSPDETLLGSYPCALHYLNGLRQGVLYVSSRHLCFETSLFPSANTKLPLSRVHSAECCRDPVFHLVPNSIKVRHGDSETLCLASFHPSTQRDDAIEVIRSLIGSVR